MKKYDSETMTAQSSKLFERLRASYEDLANFCQRWHIAELAVFGSALRDDFDPEHSDIDLLATFDPQFHRGLTESMQMQDELEALCGRQVDLVSRTALEASQNWIRKREIFNSAQVVYVRQP